MKGDGIPLTPASGPLPPRKDLFAGLLNGVGPCIRFEEFGDVAGQAEGALRQAALDEGRLAHRAQTRGAQSGAQWIGRREEPLEPVQSAGGHQILAAAPTLITPEQLVLAAIGGASRGSEHIGEGGAVQQPQIQSLPRQWMYDVRSVPEQHGSRPYVLQGVLQLERKGRRRRRQFAVSHKLAT